MKQTDLDFDKCQTIEQRFNKISFMDIPIGGTIGLYLLWYKTILKENTWLGRIKQRILLIKYAYNPYHKIKNTKTQDINTKEKIWFCLTETNERILGFFHPLTKIMNANEYIFVGNNPNTNQKISNYLEIDFLTPQARSEWKKEYDKVKKEINEALLEIKKDYKLKSYFLRALKLLLLIQTQRIVYLTQRLQKDMPKAIVVHHDRQLFNAVIILAANKLNIPTYTFIHGSTKPPRSYVPFLANKVLCWGQAHIDQFEKLGISKEKFIITGNQKANNTTLANKRGIQLKLGIAEEKFVCMLATNNIRTDLKIKLAETFCKAVTYSDNVKGIVRLHASETLKEYTDLIKKYPNVIFQLNNELTLDQAIVLADLMVLHNTTLGEEVLVKEKPIVILDVIDEPLGIGEELINEAQVPCAKNEKELIHIIDDFQLNYTKISATKETKAYIQYRYDALGDAAARRVYEAIKKNKDIKTPKISTVYN